MNLTSISFGQRPMNIHTARVNQTGLITLHPHSLQQITNLTFGSTGSTGMADATTVSSWSEAAAMLAAEIVGQQRQNIINKLVDRFIEHINQAPSKPKPIHKPSLFERAVEIAKMALPWEKFPQEEREPELGHFNMANIGPILSTLTNELQNKQEIKLETGTTNELKRLYAAISKRVNLVRENSRPGGDNWAENLWELNQLVYMKSIQEPTSREYNSYNPLENVIIEVARTMAYANYLEKLGLRSQVSRIDDFAHSILYYLVPDFYKSHTTQDRKALVRELDRIFGENQFQLDRRSPLFPLLEAMREEQKYDLKDWPDLTFAKKHYPELFYSITPAPKSEF